MSQKRIEREVLTLLEAAEYLRVPEDAVEELVKQQGLPARKVRGEWRFLKAALREWLSGPTQKEKLLGMAGAFKDDPFLPELQRQLNRGRRRSNV